MSCPACFQGRVRTDAEPTGTLDKVYGLDCYVARPSAGGTPDGVIVIVPDAFGLGLKNNKLLADTYAQLGNFIVYLPDFMDGNEAPLWTLDALDSVTKDMSLYGWLTKPYHVAWALYGFVPFMMRNSLGASMPRVASFLAGVRKDSKTSKLPIGVAGFCWGGQHAVRLCWDQPEPVGDMDPSQGSLIDAAFTAHPSRLNVPADIEKVRKPLCIAAGDQDHVTPIQQIRVAEETLQKTGVSFLVKIYEGAGHGWSVRIDRTNPKQKEQAEDCERLAVEWFKECFKVAS